MDCYLLFQRKNDLEAPWDLALWGAGLKGEVLAELGCSWQELRTVAEG